MQIIIGTGLATGPRGRDDPAAPALLRRPELRGAGRVGEPLAVDPGLWRGAAQLRFAWLKDAVPIAGAEGRTYVPAASDDGAAVACRITALGPAGTAAPAGAQAAVRTVAQTAAITIAFPPPRAIGPIPHIAYTPITGPVNVDISPFFSGDALAFSVTGDGVSIDAATGVVRLDVAALLAGGAVRVTASNSGGRADLELRLRAATPPVMLAAPALSGIGRVGAPLAVDPGDWAGEPAPEVTLQWLCEGTPVAGAVAADFVPGATQDGAGVSCRVTAANAAGVVTAETAAIAVTQAPPALAAALADVVLSLGGDTLDVPAAAAFAGTALRFAVTGAGAAVDPESGVVTLPAATRRAAETARVTATNTGGAAASSFAVTVLAAPKALAAPAPAVFTLGAGPQVVQAAAFFAGDALVYALAAAPAGVTVDAASGAVSIPTGAALDGEIAVTATNAVGAATQRLSATVRSAIPAPAAVGAPGPVSFDQNSGVRTVSAQAFFSGDDLVYALAAAPAGVTINAGSGLVSVPTAAALSGEVAVRATNAAGAATQRFALSVRALASVFDTAAALAEVRFLSSATAPAWTANAGGFARLVCGATDGDRAHGDWVHARGDGRYRALARWSAGAALSAVRQSRPFGLIGRMSKTGDDFRGVRVDALLQTTGARVLQIREYTGSGVGAVTLKGAPVDWTWNEWWWVEAEFDGGAVRARLYPDGTPAPAWQVTAALSTPAGGSYGPTSQVVVSGQTPVVDVRRLEFLPLAQAVASTPAAPLDGDWSLDQIMVQS